MADLQTTHLFTDRGALCGAPGTYRWSLVESAVSCDACRALMDQRALERREKPRAIAVTLARIRSGV